MLALSANITYERVSAAYGITEMAPSENNRKAKFYSISKAGRKQLAAEAENWARVSGVIGRLLLLGDRRG